VEVVDEYYLDKEHQRMPAEIITLLHFKEILHGTSMLSD
jgi:hypothetical protein